MPRRIVTALTVIATLVLLAYVVLSTPQSPASPNELNVISRTKGYEAVRAEFLDGQLKITLKNNHHETITAFAISFGDTTIKEDFAYSEVNFGIEPGDTFQRNYPVTPSLRSEPLTLYLLTVLLKDRTKDGDTKIAQEIKDERLGEKVQILRTLRILEKEGQSRKDLTITKNDIVAALNSGEFETRSTLNELEPTSRFTNRLSDDLSNGLQVGREKMLQRFSVLEQLPPEHREEGFIELKARLDKLFAKL